MLPDDLKRKLSDVLEEIILKKEIDEITETTPNVLQNAENLTIAFDKLETKKFKEGDMVIQTEPCLYSNPKSDKPAIVLKFEEGIFSHTTDSDILYINQITIAFELKGKIVVITADPQFFEPFNQEVMQKKLGMS